jgi:hypothetical protein
MLMEYHYDGISDMNNRTERLESGEKEDQTSSLVHVITIDHAVGVSLLIQDHRLLMDRLWLQYPNRVNEEMSHL